MFTFFVEPYNTQGFVEKMRFYYVEVKKLKFLLNVNLGGTSYMQKMKSKLGINIVATFSITYTYARY